ncbi:immunoglobulin-binding protein 1 [Drosophila guanche]|uniref:Blast:Immunoglobulin-binding protein 1 n=1 Tax=Drosophila guanche TaxID=7266 RepID=A0A3B0KHA7_DROGU|nr:immunoglobulin-binding protein 1 [Drosophila guanche]SPP85769.1 blast:Immunoglobulin-binding protein 1 [Drosophila guanche]
MADANNAEAAAGGEDKKLSDIFLSGWNLYDELDVSDLPFNGSEFQNKVKTALGHFEEATVVVNQVGMFSPNELIDEVSTDSLPFMLLPYFLGKLTTKINNPNSTEIMDLGEIYFKDHLQRCQEYELCEAPKGTVQQTNKLEKSEQRELVEAAFNRNDKIAQYRKMKEIDEYMARMRTAVKNKTADDEIRREFFLKYLDKSIIDSKQELESLGMMKELAKMRIARLAGGESSPNDDPPAPSGKPLGSRGPSSHGHSHGHSHHHQAPKPKPLQPFIITRNATQKAVFGLGYPSLPVMSVDEFYQQRVDEGIFPDAEKSAKMNQAQAIAAARDPNEQEDEEKAVEDQLIEEDDPENLARMRRMDEYKDVVRRGDGNRHNRS